MSATDDRIKYLFQQYALSQSSQAELQELYESLPLTDDVTLQRLMDEYFQSMSASPVAAQVDWNFMFSKILTAKETAPVHNLFKWKKFAIAASILLAIGLGTYVISTKEKSQPLSINQPAVADLKPGTNGAVLTKADGSKIILDNAANGVLTTEGNATVNKYGAQLVYNSEKNAVVETSYNTLTTPKGRQFQLVLADGSKVWLNAASSITYPTAFIGSERKVSITGEAYFEVTHNATKPFIVSKGEMQVQVLGTHFNVNTYDDETEIKVTLLEGSVNVLPRASALGTVIKPGQQAVLTPDFRLITQNSVDVDQVMAWKNGLFSFTDANITQIMKQVARWYDAEIVYVGNVKNEFFSGTVPRSANASALLKVMESTNTVKFDIQNGKITVRPVK